MRQNCQPTWQLVLSTAAKDTYLLSPVMLRPSQVTFCDGSSSKANKPIHYVTVILLMDFTYGCFMSTQASKQAFITLYPKFRLVYNCA